MHSIFFKSLLILSVHSWCKDNYLFGWPPSFILPSKKLIIISGYLLIVGCHYQSRCTHVVLQLADLVLFTGLLISFVGTKFPRKIKIIQPIVGLIWRLLLLTLIGHNKEFIWYIISLIWLTLLWSCFNQYT